MHHQHLLGRVGITQHLQIPHHKGLQVLTSGVTDTCPSAAPDMHILRWQKYYTHATWFAVTHRLCIRTHRRACDSWWPCGHVQLHNRVLEQHGVGGRVQIKQRQALRLQAAPLRQYDHILKSERPVDENVRGFAPEHRAKASPSYQALPSASRWRRIANRWIRWYTCVHAIIKRVSVKHNITHSNIRDVQNRVAV